MILNVYNVRDERVNEYGTPIFTDKDEEGIEADYVKSIRLLEAQIEALQGDSPEQVKSPELFMKLVGSKAQLADVAVYHTGTFDTITGKIVQAEPVLCFRVKELF